MRTLLILLISILRSVVALTRSREEQAIVELTLRQQLAVYAQNRPVRSQNSFAASGGLTATMEAVHQDASRQAYRW